MLSFEHINEAKRGDMYKGFDWSKWVEQSFTPNKAWMAKTWKELNDKYFGGYLRVPDFDLGTMENPGTIAYWKSITVTNLPYERDRKGRIIPSTVGKKQVGGGVIKINSTLRGDNLFWENTMLHEMCHQYVYQYYEEDGNADEKYWNAKDKDKTGGHFSYWTDEAERCTEVGPYVISRYSDQLYEAYGKAYDMSVYLYVITIGNKTYMTTSYKRFKDGVAKTIMTTMFPDKMEIYECQDPILCNLKRSHRDSDYKKKDAKLGVIKGMDLTETPSDSVQMKEFEYAKTNSKLLSLIGTGDEYDAPDYIFMVFDFDGQKAFCKITEFGLSTWKGKIELDPDDNYSIMKANINIADFANVVARSRNTTNLTGFEVIKTKGAPRNMVSMPFVSLQTVKDNYGRPMIAFTLNAIDNETMDDLFANYDAEKLSGYDLKWVTKVGQRYVERSSEQWDVILWRNEGQKIWNGWTVRHIHVNAIQRCIQLTQNAEEGITLMFGNEKDLAYFNAYTELPQLRNYNTKEQGKAMIDMSEWAFDSTPGSTDAKSIKEALSVSVITNRIDWKSDIANNKERYNKWISQRKLCVVWHNKVNEYFYMTTINDHKKYIIKILGECKDPAVKPIGDVIWYSIQIDNFNKLIKSSDYRSINGEYFNEPLYKTTEQLETMCDNLGMDADSEARDTAIHYMNDKITKPWSAKGVWKEDVPAESFERIYVKVCGGLPLTDNGLKFIQENGKKEDVLKA